MASKSDVHHLPPATCTRHRGRAALLGCSLLPRWGVSAKSPGSRSADAGSRQPTHWGPLRPTVDLLDQVPYSLSRYIGQNGIARAPRLQSAFAVHWHSPRVPADAISAAPENAGSASFEPQCLVPGVLELTHLLRVAALRTLHFARSSPSCLRMTAPRNEGASTSPFCRGSFYGKPNATAYRTTSRETPSPSACR